MTDPTYNYQGQELRLFANAKNWKSYFSSRTTNFVTGDILEVGAGLGKTTNFLYNGKVKNWTWLEPDKSMFNILVKKKIVFKNPIHNCINGTTKDLKNSSFDTILYLDVLEHIKNDFLELERSCQLLRRGGKIVVLSPAHNFLFSDFDRNIGHFRRYNIKSLKALENSRMKISHFEYLDTLGLCLNLANRIILKQNLPSTAQIEFWDRIVVPLSRLIDPILGRKFGKSILAVYEAL